MARRSVAYFWRSGTISDAAFSVAEDDLLAQVKRSVLKALGDVGALEGVSPDALEFFLINAETADALTIDPARQDIVVAREDIFLPRLKVSEALVGGKDYVLVKFKPRPGESPAALLGCPCRAFADAVGSRPRRACPLPEHLAGGAEDAAAAGE